MSGIIKGNFVGQPGGVFPIDVETFAQLQGYVDAVAGLVHLCGNVYNKQDGIILSGCELSSDGTRREPGWLVLTGAKEPHLVYFTGGFVAGGLTEVEESIDIEVSGVTYKAYIRYIAKPGTGVNSVNNYSWDYIAERITIADVAERQEEIEAVMAVGSIVGDVSHPVGSRQLPEGWLWCDGSQHKIVDYPELYDVLGSDYAVDGIDGYFTVPTLYVGTANIGIGMYKIRAK